MFEESTQVKLSKGSNPAAGAPTRAPFVWKTLPLAQLVQFRDEITRCLPALSLKETNLEEELLLQLVAVRQLQADVITDEEIPANQKAQVANSVAGVLTKLVDMQGDLYTQERFKAIENLLVRTLQTLPEATAAAFLEDYERVLASLK